MMARSCCIICGVVLILGWHCQVSHKCHWGGICLMLTCMVIQGKIIQMLASEIKTLALRESFHRPGGITTSDLPRQLSMPALPDHLANSTKAQAKRGFSYSSLKLLYSSWGSDLSCLQASEGFGCACVWLAAGECISWTAWRGHLWATCFSGTILLFIRANWQGRKQGWYVTCYRGKARELVAIL